MSDCVHPSMNTVEATGGDAIRNPALVKTRG
jgi:hypothetical protein